MEFFSIFFSGIQVRREGHLAVIVAGAESQANYMFPVLPTMA